MKYTRLSGDITFSKGNNMWRVREGRTERWFRDEIDARQALASTAAGQAEIRRALDEILVPNEWAHTVLSNALGVTP